MARKNRDLKALETLVAVLSEAGVTRSEVFDTFISAQASMPWYLPALSTDKWVGDVSLHRYMQLDSTLNQSTRHAVRLGKLIARLEKYPKAWVTNIDDVLSAYTSFRKPYQHLSYFSEFKEDLVLSAYQLVAELVAICMFKTPKAILVKTETDLYFNVPGYPPIGIMDMRLTSSYDFPSLMVPVSELYDKPREMKVKPPDLMDQLRWVCMSQANNFEDLDAVLEMLAVYKYRTSQAAHMVLVNRLPTGNSRSTMTSLAYKLVAQQIDPHIEALENNWLITEFLMRLWESTRDLGLARREFQTLFGNPYRPNARFTDPERKELITKLQDLKVDLEQRVSKELEEKQKQELQQCQTIFQ